MSATTVLRLLCLLLVSAATCGAGRTQTQPVDAPLLALEDLPVGATGEVWTVFQGTEPEPFEVKVVGVVQNGLGPGKSLILCELTDERVQLMGAVAGMSGSPLYIDGQLAGALSYQVQTFETVRHAGFTPIADLLEVATFESEPNTDTLTPRDTDSLQPLRPTFAIGGLDPQVQELVSTELAKWGLDTVQLGGTSTGNDYANGSSSLQPGNAVGAALAVGDVSMVATGTVSHVVEDEVLAFGHPFLRLGSVTMPMLDAEIVTILPSQSRSFKVANAGQIIGTVRQDRLSAIYGTLDAGPKMLPVAVNTPERTLNFESILHPQFTGFVTVVGIFQAVVSSNHYGFNEGFRMTAQISFPDREPLEMERLYAGYSGFGQAVGELLNEFNLWVHNPLDESFPAQVEVDLAPLAENPLTYLDNVRLSHQRISPGDDLEITVQVRDHQGAAQSVSLSVPIKADWVGRKLNVLVTNGPSLDRATGRQTSYAISQVRDFDAYLDLMRDERRTDGLHVSLVTTTAGFVDQTEVTTEIPSSLSRIARSADSSRYRQTRVREVLWSNHILPDRIIPNSRSLSLKVTP